MAGAIAIVSAEDVTIANCTFTSNEATNPYDSHGSAVYIDSSSVAISGCLFSNNVSADTGGAVCVRQNATATVLDCTFTGNTSEGNGGAINVDNAEAVTISGCDFSGNHATSGGALGIAYVNTPPIMIDGCTFTQNTCDGFGGAVFDDEEIVMSNCSFVENRTLDSMSGEGGAMYLADSPPKLLVNCLFEGNQSARNTGAIYHGIFTVADYVNCAFVGNVGRVAPVMLCYNYSQVSLTNCTIAGNYCRINTDTIYNYGALTLDNCIVWGNSPNEIHLQGTGATAAVTYSDFQGGYAGSGNVDIDPLFASVPSDGGDGWGDDPNTPADEGANDDYGDLRLTFASSLIDAGDNDAIPADIADLDFDGDTTEPTPTDLDTYLRRTDRPTTPDTGNPGTLGSPVVDMGAYEFQCPGDFNGDWQIDLSDLGAMLASYNSPGVYTNGDMNGDGFVGLSDLGALLAVYGTSCD